MRYLISFNVNVSKNEYVFLSDKMSAIRAFPPPKKAPIPETKKEKMENICNRLKQKFPNTTNSMNTYHVIYFYKIEGKFLFSVTAMDIYLYMRSNITEMFFDDADGLIAYIEEHYDQMAGQK